MRASPSRLLAVSNLVSDRFRFVPRTGLGEDDFYYYLGVRQASNLTTTGSLDQSAAAAVMHIAGKRERIDALGEWLEMAFWEPVSLHAVFPDVRPKELASMLDGADPLELMSRIGRRKGGASRPWKPDASMHAPAAEFFELLRHAEPLEHIALRHRRGVALPLTGKGAMSSHNVERLLAVLVSLEGGGLRLTPSLYIRGREWVPFGELSSGEQNVLSLGAKLLAYAVPGCVVVIDEPDASLNVAWQQRYVELIRRSIAHAEGCHVFIATHSPHMISSLPQGSGSVVLLKRTDLGVDTEVLDADFEGWGSESILYNVLDIPSSSGYHFERELAEVLKAIQDGGTDRERIVSFVRKCERLSWGSNNPIEPLVNEIQAYLETGPR